MKIGNLVKHTPKNDPGIGRMFPNSDFEIGLIIDGAQTNTEQHFWVIAGSKKGWYKESELTLIGDISGSNLS
ncbi:MAG: hypothetical protein H8E12_09020 [Rhodobacteraceae bacterium]|nr:hypothetical protein [Paracoccaceae bacterium]